MKTLLAAITVIAFAVAPASAELVISEVFYDHSGTDTGYEWVEITNTDVATKTLDLTGYIIAWGGTDYSYGQHVITGAIGDCSTFLVGGPFSDTENGDPINFSEAVDFTPDIQNSGSTADAVALFAPGANVLTDTPIDAVIYGGANTNGLIDETGLPGAVDVADAPAGYSIARTSLAGDWVVTDNIIPYDHYFSYECGGYVVGNEDSSWGGVKARYR